MSLNIYSTLHVSSTGASTFKNLTVNQDFSAQKASLEQADVHLVKYTEQLITATISAYDTNAYETVLDLSKGNTFTINLTSHIDRFSIINIPEGPQATSFSLIIYQDSVEPKIIEWTFVEQAIKWSNQDIPINTRLADAVDFYSFTTFTGGDVWYGFIGGQNFR